MRNSSFLRSASLVVSLGIAALGCGSSDEELRRATPGDSSESPSPAEPPSPATPPERVTTPPREPNGPLKAPLHQWTWIDVPGTKCGNGDQTGLAVNWGTGSDVIVVNDGGGACWDEFSCTALPKLGASSEYINHGYNRETFDKAFSDPTNAPRGLGGAPLTKDSYFDREAANNPFRESSYVFLPYCTGDLSGGDATQQFLFPQRTMHFHGRKNMAAYLELIKASFGDVSGVTLAGRSAGGFTAAINFWRFQDAFGATVVNLIDDSGPAFDQATIPLLPMWKDIWNFDGAIPEGCPDCRKNIKNLIPYYAKTYPKSRFALLSYDQDPLISVFFLQSQDAYASNLRKLATDTISPLENFRYFIPQGAQHTMSHTFSVEAGTTSKTQLVDWLTRMKNGAPDWNNVSSFQ